MHHKDELKKTIETDKKQQKTVSGQIHNLEEIIKQWIDKKAQAASSICQWIDLTYQKERTNRLKNGVKKYQEANKFKLTVGKINNLNILSPIESQRKLINRKFEECENTSNRPIPYKLNINQQVTKHNTYTLNYGLTLSANISTSALVVQAQAGIELNLGVTKEQGKEFTDAIQKEVSMDVDAQHKAIFRVDTYLTPYEDTFTLEVELTGKVPALFKNKVNFHGSQLVKSSSGHELIFIPIGDVFQDLKHQNQLPEGLTCNIQNGKVICVIQGKSTIEEYQAKVTIEKQEPLMQKSTPIQSQVNKVTFFQEGPSKQTEILPMFNTVSNTNNSNTPIPNNPKVLSTKNASYYQVKGDNLYQSKNFSKAIKAYSKSIQLDNTLKECHLFRGYAYYKVGNYEAALADFNKVIAFGNPIGDYYRNRGDSLYQLNRNHEAIEAYNKSLQLDNSLKGSYLFRGYAYYKLGNYEAALADFNKVIALDNLVGYYYQNRADTLYQLNRYHEALSDYDKAEQLGVNPAIFAFYKQCKSIVESSYHPTNYSY